MNKIIINIFIILFAISCIEKKDTVDEMPQISILSPLPCDSLDFGKAFHFTAKISDNTGLGNISMDLHNNFGHHNHGSHASCQMDSAKTAINPFTCDWIFSLPAGKTEYTFDTLLILPAIDKDSMLWDVGDYHFHIYVTDNEGYQSFTTMDVKALYR